MYITVTVVTINMQILDFFFGFANINPLVRDCYRIAHIHIRPLPRIGCRLLEKSVCKFFAEFHIRIFISTQK